MKKLIRKGLRYKGRTLKQLSEKMLINNIFTRAFLDMRLHQMVETGEVLECYGGYYMLNK